MSKDIFETDKILVTAFVGKNGNASVQIGLKEHHSYEQLTEEQVLKLCHALLARVIHQEGYGATD
ncbi:MAG: hypothetical protein KAJ19_09010 [Gammaproteobacteria bacterium]|nr:hypothetical protein [Gammaproteobacteria bacterium]